MFVSQYIACSLYINRNTSRYTVYNTMQLTVACAVVFNTKYAITRLNYSMSNQ